MMGSRNLSICLSTRIRFWYWSCLWSRSHCFRSITISTEKYFAERYLLALLKCPEIGGGDWQINQLSVLVLVDGVLKYGYSLQGCSAFLQRFDSFVGMFGCINILCLCKRPFYGLQNEKNPNCLRVFRINAYRVSFTLLGTLGKTIAFLEIDYSTYVTGST